MDLTLSEVLAGFKKKSCSAQGPREIACSESSPRQPKHMLYRDQMMSTGGEFLWMEKALAEDRPA